MSASDQLKWTIATLIVLLEKAPNDQIKSWLINHTVELVEDVRQLMGELDDEKKELDEMEKYWNGAKS